MAIIAFGNEPQTGMSTTTKYALGAAAAVAVGAVAWWMLKKKPAALKANKRKRSRKCPVCAATPRKTSTRCHRCGHSYGMRANRKHRRLHDNGIKRYTRKHKASKGLRGLRSVELLAMHGESFVARPVKGKKRGHAHSYSKHSYKLLGHGLRANAKAKAKRPPGWQKKLYKGPATKWRYTAPKKYRQYGATERSHYAFPEGFKYPIHGHDIATTKRFIRTAASRYAKFKMRIAPEYREAVGRRIEAAKKKYGIGEFNPKYARKTAGKAAKKRRAA